MSPGVLVPLRVGHEPGDVDLVAAEAAAGDFLAALGIELDGEGLRGTPGRMARAYAEMFRPRPFDLTTFPNDEGYDELVVARSLPVLSVCEHHLLPFVGVAHVGYLPGERILGLSKLARVVEHVRPAPAGPGTADPAGRRLAARPPRPARGRRRRRGGAPVHDRPRRPGGRLDDRHLRAARRAPRERRIPRRVLRARAPRRTRRALATALRRWRHDRRPGLRDRRRQPGRRQGGAGAARRGVRRHAHPDRRRGRPSLRAPAAVQGVPAGEVRAGEGVRPPRGLVRRARRRSAAADRGHCARPGRAGGRPRRRRAARLRRGAADHRVGASPAHAARCRPRRGPLPAPPGGQRGHQGRLRHGHPGRDHRGRLDRAGDGGRGPRGRARSHPAGGRRAAVAPGPRHRGRDDVRRPAPRPRRRPAARRAGGRARSASSGR